MSLCLMQTGYRDLQCSDPPFLSLPTVGGVGTLQTPQPLAKTTFLLKASIGPGSLWMLAWRSWRHSPRKKAPLFPVHKRWTLGRRQALNANGQGRLQSLPLYTGGGGGEGGGPACCPAAGGSRAFAPCARGLCVCVCWEGGRFLGIGSPSGYSLLRWACPHSSRGGTWNPGEHLSQAAQTAKHPCKLRPTGPAGMC